MKRLGELSDHVGAKLIGDHELGIVDAKTTLRASANELTFANSDRHLHTFLASDSPAAVVPDGLDISDAMESGKSFLQTDNAEHAFGQIVRLFRHVVKRQRNGISSRAHVADSAEISEDVDICPGAFIGENVRIGCGSIVHPNVTILDNTTVGCNTTIFPNVVIYENTVIGNRCIIHGGAVIGGYGFGYRSQQTHELSAQLGNVQIGDDVEIGSNSTVDRGTYDSTTIGDGSKLDDLVMIGHNCQIGKHNLLCAQVGIAGSTVTGDYVVMAGQVGVGDHLKIGDKAHLAAQSGVMHDLPGDQVYLGSPAIPAREQMQIFAVTSKLPALRKQLRKLQREIEELTNTTKSNEQSASEAA